MVEKYSCIAITVIDGFNRIANLSFLKITRNNSSLTNVNLELQLTNSVMRTIKSILKLKDLKNYGVKRWTINIHFYKKFKVNLMLDCLNRKLELCKKRLSNFRGNIYNILNTES